MDFISGWLKGIVLIILFASFMDLLLPSSAMQKYVKLVIGLIIIVAMLTPLLMIVNGKESLAGNGLFNWQGGEAMVASVMQDVQQQIAFDHQDMVVDTAKRMAREGIVYAIQLQGGFQLVDFEMSVEQPADGQEYQIKQLDVYVKRVLDYSGAEPSGSGLSGSEGAGAGNDVRAGSDAEMANDAGAEGDTAGSTLTERIEMVEIQPIEIPPVLPEDGRGSRSETAQTGAVSADDQQASRELKGAIAKAMELSQEIIRVYIVEG